MSEKYERSKWPDDTAERIKKMRADDIPWRVIGESFGTSTLAVRYQAKELGVFEPSNRYFTPAEDEIIRADYLANVNLKETGLKLGRNYRDITQRILRKHSDLQNSGIRTSASTKAIARYGKEMLEHGATPAEAAANITAKIVAAKASARVAALNAKAKHNRKILDVMLGQIEAGVDRNAAMFEARALGIALQEIGDCFGITRERVRQICDAEAFRITMNASIPADNSVRRA